MTSTYEFGILGPLLVRHSGAPVHVGAAKLRMLLASLLVEADRVVTTDTLVHRLWGDTPPLHARNTLQNYVLRLRRALGSTADTGPVRTHPRGYLIETTPQTLDLRRFTSLVRLGRTALEQNAAERAAALLRQALELWRGDPLCDLPGDAFPELRLTLQEQHLTALELRIDADLAAGRSADVLPELRALVEAHPLREYFWTQRMLALYRCERQSEALECYRTVTALLIEELGITPGPALRDMHARLLSAAPDLGRLPSRTEAASSPKAPGRPTLPVEMTGFIGREAQLEQVRALLSTARLVTLTGVGGVGKTRLALRSAAQLAASYADGVHLADLAALTAPDLLDRAVAEALGLRDQSARPPAEAIVDGLRDRQLLLLLDNCEHVADAVATLVLRMLRAAPGLTVLATSRHRLGVPGEHILTVPCLTLPDPDTLCDPQQPSERSESVRLLVQRAAASAPAFTITARNRAAVAQLCRRLDGIPLAIELAAVRLGTMTAEEMLERLDDRFRVLRSTGMPGTETRYQHTLRGVIDWSYTLCTPQERLLWVRLSVFSGGFDLSAAEAVCAGEGVERDEILDLLAALVHKSLVAVDSTGPRARYGMLETIRQYGLERLGELTRHTGLRIRHSAHYRAMTLRAGAEWFGPQEVDWLLRLREELPNLRTALDFCAAHPDHVGTAVAIAVDLARTRCWFFSSVLGEGRYWLERLLASPLALPPRPDGERPRDEGMDRAVPRGQSGRRGVPGRVPRTSRGSRGATARPAHFHRRRSRPARRRHLGVDLTPGRRAGAVPAGRAARRRSHGHHDVGHGRGFPRRPGLGTCCQQGVHRRGRGQRRAMGPYLGPLVRGSGRAAPRRSGRLPDPAARRPRPAEFLRRQLGPRMGGGDAGLGGRRDGPTHRRRPAPRCGAPTTAGHRRRADRSASVPRRPCRRRTPGAYGPDAPGVHPGLGVRRLREQRAPRPAHRLESTHRTAAGGRPSASPASERGPSTGLTDHAPQQ
ncbi:AfsR/SARP family transcriptional regulator [Streptomyces rochei]|uniref:BTAD domain-containing putative transcriptional regulator n=1 Tax=Streptomyces rochei TaxID=1928 RepID=A0AAX3ZAX1_STRRO|nr:BTAD domain-containing putative transcriptional regulator [Streptomyces rochei]WMC84192.1 BTAD domain-containing putative transcriptional regulator [Streptomyces rochei]